MSDTLTGRTDTHQQRTVTVLRGLLTAEGRDALEWSGWDEPGRAGVQIRPLYATPAPQGATAFLVRFGPGAHGDLHEHLGYELMFVLDGELINDNGDRYTAGDLVIEDPGSVHRVRTETGVTVLGVREAPTVSREAD
ncbi:quercetin dioxygenase-like cupin family protein [Streptomyces calvus]|uniref:cupin domain-containing protein n=1 Tax=Streptomyces calvus TaxID=67282 RepID=UPI0035141DAE